MIILLLMLLNIVFFVMGIIVNIWDELMDYKYKKEEIYKIIGIGLIFCGVKFIK